MQGMFSSEANKSTVFKSKKYYYSKFNYIKMKQDKQKY